MPIDYELQYVRLDSEPAETTPKKTQAWKDYTVLLSTTILVEADRLVGRAHRAVNSRIRDRNSNNH